LNQKKDLFKDYNHTQKIDNIKMETSKKFQRNIAIKLLIQDINNGTYHKEKEDEPNYLSTINGQSIYRVNLMGIVVYKEITGSITSFLIDDGSGQIHSRFFEENERLDKIEVGKTVIIIGKVREYNEQKYISPEIFKEIDPEWLKFRAKELNFIKDKQIINKEENLNYNENNNKNDMNDNLINNSDNKNIDNSKEELTSSNSQEQIKKEIVVEDVFVEDNVIENNAILPTEKILHLIKKLDQGEGVEIEEIIEKSTVKDTEVIINRLVENGEVFQNLPGKVKVL
jgi:RPA family protein